MTSSSDKGSRTENHDFRVEDWDACDWHETTFPRGGKCPQCLREENTVADDDLVEWTP